MAVATGERNGFMNTDFDIVVIGGGLYGCACAYYLTRENRKVLLIEKNRVGTSGATGYSRGIVRVYDPEASLAQLSLEGVTELLNWDKNGLPGTNPYTASGFLYLMEGSKKDLAQQAIDRYGSSAYPMELLTGNEITQRFPWVKSSEGKIGLYEQYGGYGDPRLTAQNFMTGFRAKGGTVYENCSVEAVETGTNGNWNIRLPLGIVNTNIVLVATGAFTKSLLPGMPVFTRSISLTQVSSDYHGHRMPVVDEQAETFLRPGDDSSFYCGSQVEDVADLPEQLPCRTPEVVADAVLRVSKVVNDHVEPINCFNGYDGYTEEKRPVLQFLEEMPGVYVAAGFSGRGYKCVIPVAKQIAAEVDEYMGVGKAGKMEWKVVV